MLSDLDSKANTTHPFPDHFFQKAHWTPGTEKDLPPHLRSAVTPKTATTSLGTFRAPKESDSEQESGDSLEYKEFSDPQQLEPTSTAGVPLELLMGGARQWKINKVEDLNNPAKADIRWDDWEGFKTSFKRNWSEVDSPGSAMNSIYALTEKAKKNKISMESYISLFKEYVQKAGIVTNETQPNNAAVSLFCQGLPYKVLDKAMNQNPTDLAGWYTSIQQVINARDRASILANVH